MIENSNEIEWIKFFDRISIQGFDHSFRLLDHFRVDAQLIFIFFFLSLKMFFISNDPTSVHKK